LLLVSRSARDGVLRPLRILQATAVAATVAAALSLAQLMRVGLILATSARDLLTRLLISRVSEHVTDLNAAGSHYAMAAFITVGFALHEHERGRIKVSRAWAVATVVLAAGMWISGFQSRGPASSKSTRVRGFSLSRLASTQPAEPAPTIR